MTISFADLIEPSVIFQFIQIIVIIAIFVFAFWILITRVPKRLHEIDEYYDQKQKEIDERFEKYQEKK